MSDYPSVSYSIFVSISGEIYVSNNHPTSGVNKRMLNTNTSTTVMTVSSPCYGLFIDISNTLYCSMEPSHQVVKRSLIDNATTTTTVAGNGSSGNAPNQLNIPRGIFVDINYDLYVADRGNHRIQRFRSGELNGTTVAGSGSPNFTIILNWPRAVVLDADDYLFIVDYNNHRIVRSGPYGFRCLFGCKGRGSASNQFDGPTSLSFDTYGNIFVVDWKNKRLQKFDLLTNSCGKFESALLERMIGVNTINTKRYLFLSFSS